MTPDCSNNRAFHYMIQRIKQIHTTYIVLLILSTIIISCKDQYQSTTAKVVERKEISADKIQINYIFKAGNTTIAGSKIVGNNTIISDSITVEYNKQNPLENELDIKN